jgi:hypothetical protein
LSPWADTADTGSQCRADTRVNRRNPMRLVEIFGRYENGAKRSITRSVAFSYETHFARLT